MKNFSKLFGTMIGSGLGLAAQFGISTDWYTPEVSGLAMLAGGLAGTYLAPSNKP